MASSTTSVMWFRRDLRLADNPALLAACQADEVVPLFVVDPALMSTSGPARKAYLSASLRSLDETLNNKLVVRTGDPAEVLTHVVREVEAGSVHHAADYGPYGSRRDKAVHEAITAAGCEIQVLGSPYAVAPGRVKNGTGNPYKVYTPFSRAWAEHGWRAPVEAPEGGRWASISSDEVPQHSYPGVMDAGQAGEPAATERWKRFLEVIADYTETRNLPAHDGTSQMSAHLRWGEVHPRTLLADLAPLRSAGAATYRKELAWREFYADVLWQRPASAREDLRENFKAMTYDDPGESFEAWKRGETGFPIVDAGMRELLSTGRMHNRVRMIVASFLVKDLHVWWRHGASHFMDHLIDGDLASNQHNWQWVAGSGTDASPYFRVFNPIGQGKKFDADAAYIHRWVPELRELSAKAIHDPDGVEAEGYPAQIVDHAAERKESLARFELVKNA